MIILRYLSRELLVTALAVTAVLIVIVTSSDFIRYLAQAESGKVDPSVLSTLMLFRLPSFLELIIPIAFFIAILMAYGRLYAEHEMTVLFACGISRRQLVASTYVTGLLLALITAVISLWLAPLGLQQSEWIIEQQKNRNDLASLQPGRFQSVAKGRVVSYAEALAEDQQSLHSVFMASVGVFADQDVFVIRATAAEPIEHPDYRQAYLLLKDGIRYQGRPGEADYRVTSFDHLAQHIAPPAVIALNTQKVNLRPTMSLLNTGKLADIASLQWRLSAPLLVLVVTLLGVALSHTTPRRGRYVMLFPSFLLYMVYVVMLNAARSAIERGALNPSLGLWSVHCVFFVVALVLFALRDRSWLRLFTRRAASL
ncbi:MAG: LPS export ABC transporter permease LptF [Cellvibrionaceae bacterium]|nr:LPS export ABC transporter permease LptF [Cellvibrionaceae bacterium]